ncbi:hypothetical protein RPHASCH2410_PC00925 (plasmid) [Rhizobium phaseoli Ch24-10]|nr:hypothetical protein RPHASCH2410_PC00925 [Rhizobium phaseoli Ch24-10]
MRGIAQLHLGRRAPTFSVLPEADRLASCQPKVKWARSCCLRRLGTPRPHYLPVEVRISPWRESMIEHSYASPFTIVRFRRLTRSHRGFIVSLVRPGSISVPNRFDDITGGTVRDQCKAEEINSWTSHRSPLTPPSSSTSWKSGSRLIWRLSSASVTILRRRRVADGLSVFSP